MGILFFVLFALAEITLVVLTFTKYKDKTAWLKNRAIVRGAEAALLSAIILVPTVNMKWRFFMALGILAARFIFDGIMWLVKRKKASGLKKKGWSVVNCVLSVALIFTALAPAFIQFFHLGLWGVQADFFFLCQKMFIGWFTSLIYWNVL